MIAQMNAKKLSLLLVAVFVLSGCTVPTPPVTPSPEPTIQEGKGSDILESVRGLTTPLGANAARIFAERKDQAFEANVAFSNEWIMSQITAYDKSDPTYQDYLNEMMKGGTVEGGAGMRAWLTDPQNEAFWDPTIRRNVGDEGYARVISLNAAFAPGSDEFRLAYGGIRRYDPNTNSFTFEGDRFPGPEKAVVVFEPNMSLDEQFDLLVQFSDAIRQQMFRFYEAFATSQISREQVSDFNQAYVLAGGCALAATAPKSPTRSERYLAALNLMAENLSKLGFEVRMP